MVLGRKTRSAFFTPILASAFFTRSLRVFFKNVILRTFLLTRRACFLLRSATTLFTAFLHVLLNAFFFPFLCTFLEVAGVLDIAHCNRPWTHAHQVFYVKSSQSKYRHKTPYKANPLPENPDATSFSGGRGKTRDGLLLSARLHRSGRFSHRGWCGTMVRACSKTRQPVRRPNLRCALLRRHVPQSGPRAGTCHPAFGQCALAPPIFSAAPLSMLPSRAGAPIQHA